MEDLRYWLGFNRVRGVGPARLRMLLESFGSIRAAWEADAEALQAAGLDRRTLASLLQTRETVNLAQLEAAVMRAGVRVYTWDDPAYPALLRDLADSPPVLFVKGTLAETDDWAVAVVGTRKPTAYGREVAHQLTTALAQQGLTIVSGLARGVDAIAHRAALDAGGRTLAVLGCGVDRVYPEDHRRLAQDICAQGALISDYPLGTPPEAANFPARNRLISGLSRGVLVVEAGETSGALITAEFAAQQGREVLAVPGSIFSAVSVGTHRLLREGAILVTCAADVLEALHLEAVNEQREAREAIPASLTEATLLTYLTREPTHVDELARASGMPIEMVSSTLVMMELKGLARQVAPLQYVVARENPIIYRLKDEEDA